MSIDIDTFALEKVDVIIVETPSDTVGRFAVKRVITCRFNYIQTSRQNLIVRVRRNQLQNKEMLQHPPSFSHTGFCGVSHSRFLSRHRGDVQGNCSPRLDTDT